MHVIYVKIAWVSNYRYPITKSSNWTPVVGHPRDRTQRTNHKIKNFVIDRITCDITFEPQNVHILPELGKALQAGYEDFLPHISKLPTVENRNEILGKLVVTVTLTPLDRTFITTVKVLSPLQRLKNFLEWGRESAESAGAGLHDHSNL